MALFLFSSAIGALPAAIQRFRMRCHSIPALLMLGCACALGGEAYLTGFENFTVGNDTIIGTDSWTGSYAGKLLHGVMSETEHKVAGLGNAAFIGGFATNIVKTASGNSVYVSKSVNLDPVALNEQIATFSVVFGIEDSSLSTRRDNFEFLIYNQSNALLAGLQFDNSTLDTSTGKPRRLIYRLSWNSATNSFQYVLTSFNFLPSTLEKLEIQIDYSTNLWTASLSDVPIFEDIPFYTGAATKNLGSVVARMAVSNVTTSNILPGDNYMLFDDFTIRTDPLYPAIQVEQPSGTTLTSGTSAASFGSSLVGTPVPLTFTIRNNGEAPLTGIAVTMDGAAEMDYSLTTSPTTPLAVGASTTFGVKFTPSTAGSRVAALHIASNDPTYNPFEINLTGTGLAPEIAVEQPAGTDLVDGTASVGFGSIVFGGNSSRTFTIKNTGSANLTGLAITAGGANAADFNVSVPGATTLEPGANSTFTVTFVPTALGDRFAAIQVASNDADENPFDIQLAGTATVLPVPEIAIEQPAGSDLTDAVTTKNFGIVSLAGSSSLDFTIKNVGSADLTDLAITKSGTDSSDFTVSTLGTTTLASGASTTFTVSFEPTALGARSAAIQVASNDANENPFDIQLIGAGRTPPVPEIVVEQPVGTSLVDGTAMAGLGTVLVGETGTTSSFTIRNTGDSDLTGLVIAKNGSHADDFVVAGPSTSILLPGASTTFTVAFKPTAGGTRTAALQIASNDADQNPFDINLSGIGLAPEIAVDQPAGTNLVDGTASVGFGSIGVGLDASKTFTIKNTGSADLTGLAVATDGTNTADFTVTANPASSVAPGENTTFTVRFKPAAAGSRTAAIHIASNDANKNPFDITLTGTGIGIPEIEVRQPAGTNLTDNVSSKSFGSVVVKSKVTKTFTIKNTGTATLNNLAITKNGKHAKNFTFTKPLKTSLSPGTSTTFKVTFKPSAKGTRKAAIHVASNDGNESLFDIALTGKGVAVKSSASPADSNTVVKSADKVVSFASTIRISDRKYACITIPRDANGDPGQESVEVSSNLVDWFSGPNHTKVLKDTAELLKVRDKTPMEPGNKRFIRLKKQP